MTTETQSLDEQIADRLDLVPSVCPGAGVWFRGWGTPATGVCEVCRQRLPLEGEPARYGGGGTLPEHRRPIPPFSSDIAEAFRVVEKMQERGWYLTRLGTGPNRRWMATFGRLWPPHLALAASAPEAIVRAALRVLYAEAADNPGSCPKEEN